MKQLVKLESFVDPVIEQLEQRLDKAIYVASSGPFGSVAHISLDECIYFLLADTVGEIGVSPHFETVCPLPEPQI
jgi:hypothetical protein